MPRLRRGLPTRMELIDTFPAFERYWVLVEHRPIAEQVDRWRSEYMSAWPELLRKQTEEYRRRGVNWKRIARARIFPQLPARLDRMRRLHADLVRELPRAWSRTRAALKVHFPIRFVIYVGLGCGMGWATRLGEVPAVLFGLENAVEMTSGSWRGWPRSVVPHEVAHLVHDEWRRRAGRSLLDEGRGPYWHLYEEGFATECERRIATARAFRLRTGKKDWIGWCERNRGKLARRFLRDVEARRSVRRFFGSWYDIQGHVECGYYLGAEAVRELLRTQSLLEVARLDATAVREAMKIHLARMAIPSEHTSMTSGPRRPQDPNPVGLSSTKPGARRHT
jgi:hypothetical protein